MTVTKERTTGVLLVHGIGEQSHRDTLLSFGQPIIDWLIQHVEVNDSQAPSQSEWNNYEFECNSL